MQRSSVDFPEPDGPMRHTTWCSSTDMDKQLMTDNAP
jgi:hypothetical protein